MCHRSRVRTQTCSVVNKISFKALMYTLCEDKSPGCAIPYFIISVSVHVCVYDVCCFVFFTKLKKCLLIIFFIFIFISISLWYRNYISQL